MVARRKPCAVHCLQPSPCPVCAEIAALTARAERRAQEEKEQADRLAALDRQIAALQGSP